MVNLNLADRCEFKDKYSLPQSFAMQNPAPSSEGAFLMCLFNNHTLRLKAAQRTAPQFRNDGTAAFAKLLGFGALPRV